MKSPSYRVKIGIIGCGAIGSRMAQAICKEMSKDCKVSGLFDIEMDKTDKLVKKLNLRKTVRKKSITEVIKSSDCIVEAVNSEDTVQIIEKIIKAKKSVIAMSVGKLLTAHYLYKLARKNKCYILLPSGAIAGVDAIKAASMANIKKITLTTRKPLKGFKANQYLQDHNIDLSKITKETVLFDGSVQQAVKFFPQNINVAATIALASQAPKKLHIKIIVSPEYTKNIHEIEMDGDFGRISTKTENVVCPDNPKTSYLAVLSGLQTLKQYCTGILIGT
ncbi:MAG: aspartate dehydrogenase domain-containing protein [Candidatus Omnitrophota bacterium]